MKIFEHSDGLNDLTLELIADLQALVKGHELAGRHVTLIVSEHKGGGEVDAAVATTVNDHEEFLTSLASVVDRMCAPYAEFDVDEDTSTVTPVKRILQ